jgi:hypothetical protein
MILKSRACLPFIQPLRCRPKEASHRNKAFPHRCFLFGHGRTDQLLEDFLSPHVIVECGSLDEYQTAWWKKLYFNGLGEFFYKNKIPADPDTFMDLQCAAAQPLQAVILNRNIKAI